MLVRVRSLTAKGTLCFGGGRGEEGCLKMGARTNMKGGQGSRCESTVTNVTTGVPAAQTEVTWLMPTLVRKGKPTPGRASHSDINNPAATAMGSKVPGEQRREREVEAGGAPLLRARWAQALLGQLALLPRHLLSLHLPGARPMHTSSRSPAHVTAVFVGALWASGRR